MSVVLIPPDAMQSVGTLKAPRSFYQVLNEPAPLAGMSFPEGRPWQALESIGFRSVVCLTDNVPTYDPAPLQVLRSVKFKDLYGGRAPDDPTREAHLLREVVHTILQEMQVKRGVVVHCVGGTGRTGTVIACCLRSLDVSCDKVLAYMNKLNEARRKHVGWKGWPESEWQRLQVTGWNGGE